MELIVNLNQLRQNVETLDDRLDQQVVPVLKAVSCDRTIVDECLSDVRRIAGTNINRLKRFSGSRTTMSVSPPTMNQISKLPDIDIFWMSDWNAIRALNNFCSSESVEKDVYLAVDTGESREGIQPEEVEDYVEHIRRQGNLNLEALAANPGCNSGSVNIYRVREVCNIADELGVSKVSGGSTALLDEDIPDRVDELRIGEGLLTGLHAVEGDPIHGLSNPFTVKASVIKERNFGTVYDLGSQTTKKESLYGGPKILGSWSDMSVVDDESCFSETQKWKVGYWGIVRAYDSPDVSINYLNR